MSNESVKLKLDSFIRAINDLPQIGNYPGLSIQIDLGIDACATLIREVCTCDRVTTHKGLTTQMIFRTHTDLLTPGKAQLFGYPIRVLHQSSDSMMDAEYRDRWSISIIRGDLSE